MVLLSAPFPFAFLQLCVYLFVEIIYHLWAAISIGLGWRREEFGEVFDRPWLSSSMHEFWVRHYLPFYFFSFFPFTVLSTRWPERSWRF